MYALIFTNFRATSQEKRRARLAREAKGYKSRLASSSRRVPSPSSSDAKASSASSADSVTAAAAARVGRGTAAAAAAVTITVGEVEAGMGEGAVPPAIATLPSSDFVTTMKVR